MEWIRTEQLCKTYGSGENAVHALNDVNITIERGEFVAICGASGSGKSTLLNLLGAIDRPSSGRVIIDGTDITRKASRSNWPRSGGGASGLYVSFSTSYLC